MTDLDLTTLSGPELRGLLDATRRRGQATQSYRILQEMAERREHAGTSRLRRPSPEPRVISVDLGDPMDRKEVGLEIPPAPAAAGEAEAPLHAELEFTGAERQQKPAKRPRRRELRRREPRPAADDRAPRRRPAMAVFLAGGAIGALLGWGYGHDALTLPAPLVAAFPQAPMLRAEAVPQTSPGLVVVKAETPAVEPATLAPAPEPAAAAPPEPTSVADPQPIEVATTEPPAPACEPGGYPADRAICADPHLQELQTELRQAYAEALEAHEDRALLRHRQLAWADARNDVVDPARLAELYSARTRKLVAAAAAARRAREAL